MGEQVDAWVKSMTMAEPRPAKHTHWPSVADMRAAVLECNDARKLVFMAKRVNMYAMFIPGGQLSKSIPRHATCHVVTGAGTIVETGEPVRAGDPICAHHTMHVRADPHLWLRLLVIVHSTRAA